MAYSMRVERRALEQFGRTASLQSRLVAPDWYLCVMSDFAESWQISRQRFQDAVSGLSASQLNWRIHPQVLTIGEMAIHVAGVEVSFVSQLLDSPQDGFARRVQSASTDGVVNDLLFPFAADEIDSRVVERALELGRALAEPVISNPSDAVRSKQIKSALGPIIDGVGALARLAFHAGYHQGQAHLIKTAPGFPS